MLQPPTSHERCPDEAARKPHDASKPAQPAVPCHRNCSAPDCVLPHATVTRASSIAIAGITHTSLQRNKQDMAPLR